MSSLLLQLLTYCDFFFFTSHMTFSSNILGSEKTEGKKVMIALERTLSYTSHT